MDIRPRALLALILCALFAILPRLEGSAQAGAAVQTAASQAVAAQTLAPTPPVTLLDEFPSDVTFAFEELLSAVGDTVTAPESVIPAADGGVAVQLLPLPTTVPPTTVPPTTVPPTTVPPTTVPPTTVAPEGTVTAEETVVPEETTTTTTSSTTTSTSTTVPPTTTSTTTSTTVPPTTVAPTTVAPTTAPPTTVAPTTAPPTTVAPTAPPRPVDSRPLSEQMLDLVSFDWRSAFPNWSIEFEGERSGIRGLTYPGERRVVIFIRSNDTPESLHRVFAHEIGHVVDVELNSNEERERWRQQRGIASNVPWWPSAEAPDFATGAGDFAEAFAVLETGITTRSTVAPQPSSADLALMRELMRG